MKLFTILTLGIVFSAGVVVGLFAAESDILTAKDIRRLHNFTVARLRSSPVE